MEKNEYSGFYLMLNFIRCHKSDVPEELRNDCIINENGLTLAMYWIRFMKKEISEMIKQGQVEETVPKWMRHDPNLTDKNGWTIANHWIEIFKCDVPKWMRCNPNKQNSRGKTIGMFWLMIPRECNKNVEFPEWMRCECDKFDEHGNSILDYWLEYTIDDVPDWMNIDKNFRNGNGETPEMSFVIHRADEGCPNHLRQTKETDEWHVAQIIYNKNIKTNYGFTYKDIYLHAYPELNDTDFEVEENEEEEAEN